MRISDWSSDVCSSDLADVDAAIAANVELITAVDADDAEVLDRRLGAIAGAARHRDLELVRHPAAPAHPFELDAKPGRILRAKAAPFGPDAGLHGAQRLAIGQNGRASCRERGCLTG